MKKLTLLIILAFIFQATASSQSCLPEGITFTTQEQIDNFQTNYPGCTEILGDVEIGSYPPNSNITNLDGLSEIFRIDGSLWITYNELLSDFSGLNSLKYCYDLQMAENNSVINFAGFDSLDSITYVFSIAYFDSLETVSGFNNLVYIGDNMFINHNVNLVDIDGFNSLSSSGPLYLTHNYSLSNISGFSSLSSVYCLYISNNNSLTGLSGFDQLDSINAELLIYQCNNISDLSALQNLSFIGGLLNIRENPQLISLTGLDSVNLTSIYQLKIKNNSSLSECAVKSICDLLDGSTASIEIENNAAGCNSPEEVEDACWSKTDEFVDNRNDIQIFPNPAKKTITILSSSEAKIKEVNIYNQTGQKVLHKKPITHTIDISMLRQGMYIIELVTNESKIREKLIIK